MSRAKMVLETVGVELIDRLIADDEDCYDFTAWASAWPGCEMHRRTVEMLGELSSKSKSWLKEKCQSNTHFKEHVIACLAATNVWVFGPILQRIGWLQEDIF